jgi:hypothetical protein
MALKDVRRAVIPHASHASNIDNPAAFEREVLAFLKERRADQAKLYSPPAKYNSERLVGILGILGWSALDALLAYSGKPHLSVG